MLTVLCYHRIASTEGSTFVGFKPNISASPESFRKQLIYYKRCYNPISLQTLGNWLDGEISLPPRPLLITFDDGYKDNGQVAWPILRQYQVPAAIFLATDYIGTGRAFIWDVAAYYFSVTAQRYPDVPMTGRTRLLTEMDRDRATYSWVQSAKLLSGSDRMNALSALANALQVEEPDSEIFRHLYLDWSDVQQLAAEGLEFGGHTCSHPILSRVPLCKAVEEISGSNKAVESALGRRTLGFAYPNGSPADFSIDHEKIVIQSGCSFAFSLEPGPMLLSEVKSRPMAIRRIYVSGRDNLPRLAAKTLGLGRILLIFTRQV
jgi:peptidoglycan/xylan/chitin deacetylase (PgdA/CDA1 family)